jgi:hypothetical protein
MEVKSMDNHKPSVRLEDWAVVPIKHVGEYQQLRPGNSLVGRAFGHPRIQEGLFIFTSAIQHCDGSGKIVETRNTTYNLGEPSYEYKTCVREHQESNAA